MSNWTNKWKKILLWVASYLSFIGFILVGGCYILKGDDDLKAESKKCFITLLPFIALSALITLINDFMSLSDSVRGASGMVTFSTIVDIIKIITFVVMIILVVFEKKKEPDKKENTNNSEVEDS